MASRRQKHEATWLKQCEQWTNLILSYCSARRIFEVELSKETLDFPLFANKTLDSTRDAPRPTVARKKGFLTLTPLTCRTTIPRDALRHHGVYGAIR